MTAWASLTSSAWISLSTTTSTSGLCLGSVPGVCAWGLCLGSVSGVCAWGLCLESVPGVCAWVRSCCRATVWSVSGSMPGCCRASVPGCCLAVVRLCDCATVLSEPGLNTFVQLWPNQQVRAGCGVYAVCELVDLAHTHTHSALL